jgi:hypothetical protein
MVRATPDAPFAGDIEIEIITESLAEQFLISPNDLHRGRGDWAGTTLRDRGLLAALLTMRSGFVVSRQVIDDLAPELGHKGVSTVLRHLKQLGFLTTTRINGEDGRFRWRWRVCLRPNRVTAGHTMGPSTVDGEPADGSTIDPSGDDGADLGEQGVCPGRTISPSAIDGQGDVLRRPLYQEELEEEPPPPPSYEPEPPSVVDARNEEEERDGQTPDLTEQARDVLRQATTGLPAARFPTADQAGRLVGLAAAALRGGWLVAELARRLGEGDLSRSESVYAVLQHRLRTLGDPPQSRPAPVVDQPHTMSPDTSWRQSPARRTDASADMRAYLLSGGWTDPDRRRRIEQPDAA